MRYNADPRLSYEDNRMQMILDNITEIGINLRTYEQEKWEQLLDHNHQIFNADYKQYMADLKKN
jgi:hypothetical protein